MKVRLLVLALVVGASLLPASGAPALPPEFDCAPDDGREWLTTDGFSLDFEAPNVAAPELAATREITGDGITRQRSAHFHFRAVLAPYTRGDLEFSLEWEDPNSDYDLYVFDEDGAVVAASDAPNIEEGTTHERAEWGTVSHCTDFSVEVRNWLGSLDEILSLDIAFTNPGPPFLCEEEDPHPACEGKEEGELPDLIPDTRTRLYLESDRPGQLAMAAHYPAATAEVDPPMSSRLVQGRPTGGSTNTFTHYGPGFTHQARNPFKAHFSLDFAQPVDITGDLHVELWVSSQTLQDGGTLWVDLFVDSTGPLTQTRVARLAVPGEQIETIAGPLFLAFKDLDLQAEQNLTIQVASEPLATSEGVVGDPADVNWTLYYDSVQFPGRITLDLPPGAIAPA